MHEVFHIYMHRPLISQLYVRVSALLYRDTLTIKQILCDEIFLYVDEILMYKISSR